MSPDDIAATPEQAALVNDIARPYLWWAPAGQAHGFVREVAEIMNLGTYDDILRLESAVDGPAPAAVMGRAQPGWFDARSWEFWRGRLSARIGAALPGTPPRRQIPEGE